MSDELTLWEQPISRRGFVAGATAAALAAAGLGRLGPEAFAATEAGTLNFYNWAQYVNPKTYAAFTKATGIKVKKSFYDSNETLHAKLKAGARGYDLVCPSNYMTKQLIAEDLVEPLDWSKLRNVTKNVDPKFHNTPDDPKSTYSVVKDWGTTGFMYRTDKIKERPTTWREFVALTKKYGKTTMVDSSPEVLGSIATMLGYSYSTEDKKELDAVKKVLFELKPYIVALHSSNYDTLIANGKAWMGLGWSGDGLLLASKVPAQYVVAKEGGELWIDYYNIPVGAKNPRSGACVDQLRLLAEEQWRRDVVYVLRLAAQAVVAEGNRGREALERQGGLPTAGGREEARDQPGHCERKAASGADLDGVQGVVAFGVDRS